jgi:hypothetical protein
VAVCRVFDLVIATMIVVAQSRESQSYMTQTRTILGLEDISRVDKCLAMFFSVFHNK